MKHTRIYFRHGLSLLLIALLSFGQPAALVLADDGSSSSSQAPATTDGSGSTTDPSSTSTPSTTPAVTTPDPSTTDPTTGDGSSSSSSTPTTPGVNQPTGPQTPTGPSQNNIPIPDYAFNDATQQWVPTVESSFTWNQSLGLWVSPLYSYDSVVGWYHVIPTPPASATTVGAGSSSSSTDGAAGSTTIPAITSGSSATNDPEAELAQLLGVSDPSISNTGPDSTNTGIDNDNSNAMLNLLANALVNNNDTSTATTGDADVTGNTSGGSATTGAASVVDNLLNLLNAAWSLTNGDLGYFSDNIFGNQTGNLLLDPTVSTTGDGSQLGSTGGALSSIDGSGPDSTNTATDNSNNNLTVNSQPTGAINNTVNALAQSGNASVSGNTAGGDATSGDASADVNILNLINSAINAGQSFLGLVNIFGNLNGNILFPAGFLNAVGATSQTAPTTPGTATAAISNTGTGSTDTATTNQNNNTTINNDPSAAFTNNINTAAQSGTAGVSNNTSAGDATSGSSTTDNNLFNLFNDDVLGDNAVLVLVNVMGTWLGGIMNLPDADSSTGALLTGDATVTQNDTGPGSTNTTTVNQNNNTTVNNSPSGTITNNINAGAISGNAAVSDNTSAGNATSGNASVATNIANIFGSSLNLSKWFGVLVINVFGNWTGSVADDTPASDPTVTAVTPSVAGLGGAVASTVTKAFTSAIFPASSGGQGTGSGASGGTASAGTVSNGSSNLMAVVASAHEPVQTAAKSAARLTSLMAVLAAVMLMLAAAAFKLERRLGDK